jgi:hypothetical protein
MENWSVIRWFVFVAEPLVEVVAAAVAVSEDKEESVLVGALELSVVGLVEGAAEVVVEDFSEVVVGCALLVEAAAFVVGR